MKKHLVLWLTKPHAYNRTAEAYCHLRYLKANRRASQIFWINCHLLYTFLADKSAKEETC